MAVGSSDISTVAVLLHCGCAVMGTSLEVHAAAGSRGVSTVAARASAARPHPNGAPSIYSGSVGPK